MRLFFTLILFFAAFCGVALGQAKPNKADSLKQAMQTKSGDEKSGLLVQLARLSAANGDTALAILSQAIKEAKSEETKGKVYFEKALLYRYLEKDTEQFLFLDSTYAVLVSVNDSIACDALHYKHMLLAIKGRYKEALKTGHQELAIRKKLPSRDKELNALLQIGYTYDRMGEYQQAIEWYQKGLKLKDLKNEDYIGRNYGLMGIAYDELKDYEKAVSYNLKAIEHFKKKANSTFLHTWYSNLGNTYMKMGKLNLAKKYTLLALEDTRKKRYVTLINLANIYLKEGNFDEAEKRLKKVSEELRQVDQPVYLSEAYYSLYDLYKKKGNLEKALFFHEKYKGNEDKRISTEKLKQLSELTIQYETAEKEKQILQQKEKITNHQLALKNRGFWIFGLTALAVIIGLIGFLLYKQQTLKNIQQQKDNELKLAVEKVENQNKLQEQRLSISRDLHDNIGAQLSFIVSAIDTIKYYVADKNDRLTHKLDNVGSFAKETIQELRDTIWAMNKSGITIKDLQARIANFIEKAKQSYPNIHITLNMDKNIFEHTTFTGLQGLNIFRIVQEATNNALKYAEAEQIDILIKKRDNTISFLVKDNGKGFVENEIEPGNGLLNMRKRALELGNELALSSEAGGGTSVSFNIGDKK